MASLSGFNPISNYFCTLNDAMAFAFVDDNTFELMKETLFEMILVTIFKHFFFFKEYLSEEIHSIKEIFLNKNERSFRIVQNEMVITGQMNSNRIHIMLHDYAKDTHIEFELKRGQIVGDTLEKYIQDKKRIIVRRNFPSNKMEVKMEDL